MKIPLITKKPFYFLSRKENIINYPEHRLSKKQSEKYRNYEWLYNQYIILNKSTQDIADEIGCKRNTVQTWLKNFDIKKDNVPRFRENKEQYKQYDYLYQEHIINHKSKTQIAKENNVSQDTIRYWLNKNKIKGWVSHPDAKLREHEKTIIYMYVVEKMSAHQIAIYFHGTHKTVIKILKENNISTRNLQEAQFAYLNKEPPNEFYDQEWLKQKHWEENLTCAEIGEILGVDASTVMRQMDKLQVKRKNNSEAKKGQMVGSNHPNWKGGLSPFKALLREFFQINIAPIAAKRDNYTCQLCGKTHTVLHVHHIKHFSDIVDEIITEHPDLQMDIIEDREKMYDIITHDPRFLDIDNLITYCKDCHFYKIHKYKKRK